MNGKEPLRNLFGIINGCLPYEYDEKYVNGVGLEDTIVISKTNSERNIYITANVPDTNILDITLYDDIHDDDPAEITQWDTDDPNLNLMDLITYVKHSL